jgi:hypothetical protein
MFMGINGCYLNSYCRCTETLLYLEAGAKMGCPKQRFFECQPAQFIDCGKRQVRCVSVKA